ncbi:hypothetical protein CLOM_g5685 [Closterium sp. NIES-68]|nr:hypothetical protein CLOM_g5685 [Closterium sp. NIES-68]GJP64040.1 hypothetical protein CLOP_g21073 [Closterium sp. NIES-67]
MWAAVGGGTKTRAGSKIKESTPPGYTRHASHAGSWYTDDAEDLGEEIEAWLAASGVTPDAAVRAVIAPRRIFLLGPSHHHYTRKCVLPRATSFHTPVAPLPIDTQVISELRATGEFEEMGRHVDEAEHSLEMHAPFLAHLCKDHNVLLVPIMVGSLDAAAEARYGGILSRYFSDSSNFFSISSDFCHWGSRFRFTPYDKAHGPIHKAIEAMDREGMALIETGKAKAFRDYIERTGNTVCGRHPIGLLLQMAELSPSPPSIRFVQYEQSSHCHSMRDSSVSYASAVVTLAPSTRAPST